MDTQRLTDNDAEQLQLIADAASNADESLEITIRGFSFTMYELRERAEEMIEEYEAQEDADDDELRSEQDTPEVQGEVLEAFRQYVNRENLVGLIDVFFEHGQWWARIQFDQEQFPDRDERTFSVVDAEGGPAINGFDFEEV